MGKKNENKDRGNNSDGLSMFEATITDVRHHNSKNDDNSWVDLTVRVLGEAGITSAMGLHKAKDKIVKVIYQEE